jgi:hypothetical protein
LCFITVKEPLSHILNVLAGLLSKLEYRLNT